MTDTHEELPSYVDDDNIPLWNYPNEEEEEKKENPISTNNLFRRFICFKILRFQLYELMKDLEKSKIYCNKFFQCIVEIIYEFKDNNYIILKNFFENEHPHLKATPDLFRAINTERSKLIKSIFQNDLIANKNGWSLVLKKINIVEIYNLKLDEPHCMKKIPNNFLYNYIKCLINYFKNQILEHSFNPNVIEQFNVKSNEWLERLKINYARSNATQLITGQLLSEIEESTEESIEKMLNSIDSEDNDFDLVPQNDYCDPDLERLINYMETPDHLMETPDHLMETE